MLIERAKLTRKMTLLLGEVIEENRLDHGVVETSGLSGLSEEAPLIGPGAVLSSVSLVSFITDVEMMLSEDWGLEVTLVSEEALSRTRSPFRNLGALADLVLEMSGERVAR